MPRSHYNHKRPFLDQPHLLACQEAVRRGGEEANPGPLSSGEVAEAAVAKEE